MTGQYEPFGVVNARVEDDDRRRWLQDGSRLASIWHLSLCPIHFNVFINAGDDNEAYCLYGH